MIERYRRPSLAAQARTGEHHRQRMRSASPSRSLGRIAESDCGSSVAPSGSQISLQLPEHIDDDEDADEEKPQDLQEIWFPGCHAVSVFFWHTFSKHGSCMQRPLKSGMRRGRIKRFVTTSTC